MRSEAGLLVWMLLIVLAIRLAVFPLNEHLYGDAVPRTEMAEAWARAPHVITSFGDGAAQYGPLHLYLVAAALTQFDRNDAARVVSLLFGVLTVVPLWAVTRRYFGQGAAIGAALGFAVWGLHVQASTTGGSEALALFLMWTAFAWFARGLDEPHWIPFAIAALAMNLAAATRYDAWMYIPLLAAMPLWQWADKGRAVRFGALFALLCLLYPIFWMVGNAAAHNDALYPLTYIDEFHRAWAADSSQGWRQWWARAQGLGFWPAMALVTLSPGIAILGALGMVRAWHGRPTTQWLVIAAVVPALYYTFRAAVLLDFVPLARFTTVQVSLLLPFFIVGWVTIGAAHRAKRATIALALLVPFAIGVFTYHRDTVAATVLKPISPVATNPVAVMEAARFIRREIVARGYTLALDEDVTYIDLQVGFFARVTNDRTARLRWPGFRERVEAALPDFVVLFDRGRLRHQDGVRLDANVLTLRDQTYIEVPGVPAPVRVFRRERPRQLRPN